MANLGLVDELLKLVHRVRFMVFNDNFQQYFSYIVVASFIGGGNWGTLISSKIYNYQ
jgi:hypothetical protein